MFFNHIGLVCSTEDKCDRFYGNILELKKGPSKELSSDLSKGLFDIDQDYTLLYYSNDNIKFEIFLSSQQDYQEKRIGHICIDVENRASFLSKCESANVEIVKVIKNGSYVIFIKDYDGNLFEIKEKQ